MSSRPPAPGTVERRLARASEWAEQLKRLRILKEKADHLRLVCVEAPPRPCSAEARAGGERGAAVGSGEEMDRDDEFDSVGSDHSGDEGGGHGENSEFVEYMGGVNLSTYETLKNEFNNINSTLRENSVELERAKALLSERDTVIRYLVEKLAGCQSELGASEKKLNDVEASLKSQVDKQRKAYICAKRKLDTLTREKEGVDKENQSLLEQMDDLKSTSFDVYQSELGAWERKLKDVEANLNSEIDKEREACNLCKRMIDILTREKESVDEENRRLLKEMEDLKSSAFAGYQSELRAKEKMLIDVERKLDTLTREREDVWKENQSLLKQIEDLKSRQKTTPGIGSYEQASKEKDFRIQTLEKLLEKERDVIKKQKLYRRRAEDVFCSTVETISKEKKQVENSIQNHRQAVKEVIEHYSGQPSCQIPPTSTVEERFRSYFLAVKRLEESPCLFRDGATCQTPPVDIPTVDASTGRSLAAPTNPAEVKVIEERVNSSIPKPSIEGPGPVGRKPLVRPVLERGDENPPLKKSKEKESSQSAVELMNDQSPLEDVTAQDPVVPYMDCQHALQPAENTDKGQASIPAEVVEEPRGDEAVGKDGMEGNKDSLVDIIGLDRDVNIHNDTTAVKDFAVVQSLDAEQRIEDIKEPGQFTSAQSSGTFTLPNSTAEAKIFGPTLSQNFHPGIRATPCRSYFYRKAAGRGSRGDGGRGGR